MKNEFSYGSGKITFNIVFVEFALHFLSHGFNICLNINKTVILFLVNRKIICKTFVLYTWYINIKWMLITR